MRKEIREYRILDIHQKIISKWRKCFNDLNQRRSVLQEQIK